jgi:hypothetical protein
MDAKSRRGLVVPTALVALHLARFGQLGHRPRSFTERSSDLFRNPDHFSQAQCRYEHQESYAGRNVLGPRFNGGRHPEVDEACKG